MGNRLLACILSFVLAIGLMPLPAFAADTGSRAARQVRAASGNAGSLRAGAIATATDEDLAAAFARDDYGVDDVRRLYTRTYTLRGKDETMSAAEQAMNPQHSPQILIDNPAAGGHDIAVRFEGETPILALTYMGKATNLWKGWTNVYASRVVELSDGVKVALFPWDVCQSRWSTAAIGVDANGNPTWKSEQIAAGGLPAFDCLVLTLGDAVPAASRSTIIEVVELGGGHVKGAGVAMRDAGVDASDPHAIVDALYAGYNLGGHLESNWQERGANRTPVYAKDSGWSRSDLALEVNFSRGTYIDRATIADIKRRGFKAVRLPVSWYQHIYSVDERGRRISDSGLGLNPIQGNDTDMLRKYHIDRAWMERVHEIVDWCLEQDLYVIVNTHHDAYYERGDMGKDGVYEEMAPEFRAVWSQIAAEFAGYDQRLIFEGMNEPHAEALDGGSGFQTPNDGEVKAVNKLNQDFVDVVRGAGEANPASRHAKRLIMSTPYCGGLTSKSGNTSFQLPNDPEKMLALSVHSYSPHSFTHFANKDSEGRNIPLEEAEKSWADNVFSDEYRETQSTSFNVTRQHHAFGYPDIPLIYGEFGSFYCGESRQLDRMEWFYRHLTYIKELGAPAFIWGMDRSYTNATSKTWNVYDEDKHEWSAQTAPMLDMWFALIENDELPKGAWRQAGAGEHAALAEGVDLLEADSVELYEHAAGDNDIRVQLNPVGAKDDQRWSTSNQGLIESALAGDKEIAVKFTGDTPKLWLATTRWNASQNKDSWVGWVTLDPTSIVDGVAYFPAESIRRHWTSRAYDGVPFTMSELSVMFVRVGDVSKRCTVTDARLLDMPEHDWSAPDYFWNADNGSVLAIRTCKNDINHYEHETVQTSLVSSTDAGTTTYTATFANPAFERQVKTFPNAEQDPTQDPADDPTHDPTDDPLPGEHEHSWDAGVVTKEPTCDESGVRTYTCSGCNEKRIEIIAALEHDWGSPSYLWADDCSSVKARAVCTQNASHVTEETVVPTREIAKAPTETAAGEAVYTARFSNAVFSDQVKHVAIPATGPAKPSGGNDQAAPRAAAAPVVRPVVRLCQDKTGQRRYTMSTQVVRNLARSRWRYEGIAFYAPAKGGKPVYQLKRKGRFIYTGSASEVRKLKKAGWTSKKTVFWACKTGGVKVYRMRSKATGAYVLTKKKAEVRTLKKQGWKSQGAVFSIVR